MKLAIKKKSQVKAAVDVNMNVWDASEKLYDALGQFISSYENASVEDTDKLEDAYNVAFSLVQKLEQTYPQMVDDMLDEL